jgi:DNA-binding CsgD family transcriptional regulator
MRAGETGQLSARRPSSRAEPCVALPGVVILDRQLRLCWQTPAGRDWLAVMLPASSTGALPPAVAAVATTLLARDGSTDSRRPIRVLHQLGPQRWAALHAAWLEGDDARHLAVVIEQPCPGEVRGLLCQAWGLSPRERALLDLVVQGLSTGQMAERLGIRPHTVQDHIEAIFAKVGVRSRRELLSRLLLAAQS